MSFWDFSRNFVVQKYLYFINIRRMTCSFSQMLFKRGFLKTFTIFTGLQACSSIKKRLQHRSFPVNIAEILRIAIFTDHLWRLLEWSIITLKQVKLHQLPFWGISFRETVRNYWSIGRGIFTAESDLSRVALATLL